MHNNMYVKGCYHILYIHLRNVQVESQILKNLLKKRRQMYLTSDFRTFY